MAGASLTTLNSILKEFYLPPVVEQLNNEVLLLSRVDSSDQEIVGTKAYIPVHTTRTGGIGARGEYVALPNPGSQGYARAQFDLTYQYGVVRVSGPSQAKTASEAGAFLQSLRSELDGIRNDLKKDLARQLYGTGDGKLATCGVTSASATVVVSSAEAINKGQIYPGMYLDIGTVANPTVVASNVTVQSVNAAGPSVVIDQTVTTAGTHFLFRAGSNFAGGTYEMNGLQNLVASAAGTFGGIDASATGNSYWDNLRDTAGTAITQDRLMQAFNKVRINGGEVSAIYTSYGDQRQFFNTFTSAINYIEPLKLQGGFQTLNFMAKPIIADIDAPMAKWYLIDERFIKFFSNQDWHFLDEDNQPLKWDTNYDAWKSVLARYLNLGASRRNTQVLLTTNVSTLF
jgi:hypothetical protein